MSVLPLDVDENADNSVPIDDLLQYEYNCKTLEFDKFKLIESQIKKEILDCSSDEGA